MKATILLTLFFLVLLPNLSYPMEEMLSSNEGSEAAPSDPEPAPLPSPREYFLKACNEPLGEIQQFLHNNKVLLQARWYDKLHGSIIEVYATSDGQYVMEIEIVSSGGVCIKEGFMYKDLRGYPI